jgi:eukaryotic-like serine/threonine-protein kinase
MTLASDSKLGPYEILNAIGAGGMGEVYRALDTRLGREVAIKVLPAEVAHDSERLRRFEQEARAASALNHPAILTVHDFATHEGVAYLVTELLAGASVRTLLEDGPIPVKRATGLAAQVAKGLAVAHDRGIVHRDLKPDNLFVTESGSAKILDFGLARFVRPERAEPGVDGAATRVETSAGMLLGTAGYMAPEQVRGERVDARSDLFSLGVVLHEMLAGANPFRRDSVVESLNAILKEEAPDLPAGLHGSSPALGRIVARLLEKEPAQRFHSAHDLVFALEELSAAANTAAIPRAEQRPVGSRAARWVLPLGVAVASAGLALVSAWLLRRAEPPPRAALVRFEIPPPEGGRFRSGHAERHDFALSPDGKTLAFAASVHGVTALHLRDLGSLEPRVLPGTEGAHSPFWSPDGSVLAFFAAGKLRRIARAGGPAQVICDVQGANSGSWGSAGTIVFSQTFAADPGIFLVAAAGGKPEKLPFGSAKWIEFLPDGQRFLYWQRDDDSLTGRIRLGDLVQRESRLLLDVQSQARYAAPGWLLYVRAGALVAQRFDAARAELSGEPLALAADVPFFFNGWAAFSVASGHALAYQVQPPPQALRWLDRHGREIERIGPEGRFLAVRLSPDGTAAVTSRSDPNSAFTDLWIVDLLQGGATRLTDEPYLEYSPVWSPDGERIAYSMGTPTPQGAGVTFTVIVRRVADGAQVATASPYGRFRWVRGWREDGLFVDQAGPRGDYDIVLWPSLEGEPRPLVQTEFQESSASPSPDGRWLALYSSESGRGEIQIVRADGSGRRVRVSEGASPDVPRWRADGRELYYVSAEEWLTAVAIDGGETLAIGQREALFASSLIIDDSFDVSADGQRFLVTATRPPRSLPVVVTLNWQAMLPEH